MFCGKEQAWLDVSTALRKILANYLNTKFDIHVSPSTY